MIQISVNYELCSWLVYSIVKARASDVVFYTYNTMTWTKFSHFYLLSIDIR